MKTQSIRASGVVVDVTDGKQVDAAFQKIVQDFNKVDVLIQCAGFTGRTNVKSHDVDINGIIFIDLYL